MFWARSPDKNRTFSAKCTLRQELNFGSSCIPKSPPIHTQKSQLKSQTSHSPLKAWSSSPTKEVSAISQAFHNPKTVSDEIIVNLPAPATSHAVWACVQIGHEFHVRFRPNFGPDSWVLHFQTSFLCLQKMPGSWNVSGTALSLPFLDPISHVHLCTNKGWWNIGECTVNKVLKFNLAFIGHFTSLFPL